MPEEWYYANGEKKQDPIMSAQLKVLAMSGALEPTDLVWTEGMTDLIKASAVRS